MNKHQVINLYQTKLFYAKAKVRNEYLSEFWALSDPMEFYSFKSEASVETMIRKLT